MIVFTIIAIIVIGFLWKNITIYDYRQMSSDLFVSSWNWGLDIETGRRFALTPLRIIVLLLLLIPWFNIVWFLFLLIQIGIKSSYPEDPHECTIWIVEIGKNSPRLTKILQSISKFLNKELT
nr:MAG TPA: hypothetical protein [Crassvirales sp.]